MTLALRIVIRQLGLLLLVLSALILAVAAFAWIQNRPGAADVQAFLITGLIALLAAGAMLLAGRYPLEQIGQRAGPRQTGSWQTEARVTGLRL